MAGRKKPKEPKMRDSNLLKRFDKINLTYFGGLVCGGIGWRSFSLGKDNENLALACCDFAERFIRVSVVLDDVRVPLWYLDVIIYHEMLHLHLGPRQFDSDSYAYPHDFRFQCLERRHPDYERSEEFEGKMHRVINAHRRWREWERSRRPRRRLAAKRGRTKK
jgi:hypothetical protein